MSSKLLLPAPGGLEPCPRCFMIGPSFRWRENPFFSGTIMIANGARIPKRRPRPIADSGGRNPAERFDEANRKAPFHAASVLTFPRGGGDNSGSGRSLVRVFDGATHGDESSPGFSRRRAFRRATRAMTGAEGGVFAKEAGS